MNAKQENLKRPDLKQTFQRDFQRHERRERGHGTFWKSLSILGSVGWPIVLLTAGGAIAGYWLDRRLNSGVRFALIFVTCGALLGSWIAWHLVGATRR